MELWRGAPVAARIYETEQPVLEALAQKGVKPTLAVVRVGEREDDLSYERGLKKAAGDKIDLKIVALPENVSADAFNAALADLNAEEYATAIAYIGAADDFVNPEFSFAKTAYGTDVIIVNEADDDSDDEVELISIYEGYIIAMSIVKNDSITDEDIAAALQLLSDMWIVGVGQ